MSSSATSLFPRASLHPAALAWADAHARNDDTPWCVAFSGGADSLALLICVREHYPQKKIIALHFNHHMRAAASDADQQFCEHFCARHGIELRIGHWQRTIANSAAASEAEARDARHDFISREMATLGAQVLWLGHQLDDIAETQLMRLARGSSTAGLAAPRPVHTHADGRTFLRLLLTLSKKQITDALHLRGLTWCEDATNHGGDYYRNRLRRDVIPAWIAAAENDALAGAALTRELLDEDAAALDAWLDELMPPSAAVHGSQFTVHGSQIEAAQQRPTVNRKLETVNLSALAGKPRALLRRALRRWPPAAELARPGFEALLAICEKGGGQTSIGDATAIFENGILRLQPTATPEPPPFHLNLILNLISSSSSSSSTPRQQPVTLTLPDNSTLTAELVALTPALRTDILAGRFDPINTIFIAPPTTPQTAHALTLTIRSWRNGDRYQPLGAPGAAKVSDLFINRKIPHERRLTLPVVCLAPGAQPVDNAFLSEILWIPGLPPADAWKIKAQTPQALHLTYHAEPAR